jgi:hypothetical protein
VRWSGVFATRHAAAARGSIGGGGGGGCGREGASIRRSLVRAFQRNARPEVGDVTLIQSLLLDAIRILTIGAAMRTTVHHLITQLIIITIKMPGFP